MTSEGKVERVVCENCDKKTQKALPGSSIASEGKSCGEAYRRVSECMERNKGQVAACATEWDVFRSCHDANKNNKR